MNDKKFDADAYFERINYKGRTYVSDETLYDLHISHTLNVPFENLDVFYGKTILLDENSLFKKIVKNRRGGYCFEMNGIFSIVLRKLGFKVTDLLARVTIDGAFYTAKTHQAILVEIKGRQWIADVGFGNDGITAPLLLRENSDQTQFAHTYRLIKDAKYGWILQKKSADKYNYKYAFTMEECSPADFVMSNHFTSTYSESFFTKMRMCTMPTTEGRITLTDGHFKIIRSENVHETEVFDENEFNTILKDNFKLDLNLIK